MLQQLLGMSQACCGVSNNKQTPCAACLAATSQSSFGNIGSYTRCICLISFWCVQLCWRSNSWHMRLFRSVLDKSSEDAAAQHIDKHHPLKQGTVQGRVKQAALHAVLHDKRYSVFPTMGCSHSRQRQTAGRPYVRAGICKLLHALNVTVGDDVCV